MPFLLALAGFVVFLCVFGLRGLMIAGAVVGVLIAALYGFLGWQDHLGTVRQQAAVHARPIAPSVRAEPSCEEQYASVSDGTERVSLVTWCRALAEKRPPASRQDVAYAAMLWRIQGEAFCTSYYKTADEQSGCLGSWANGD
jgi:hypothetical protein